MSGDSKEDQNLDNLMDEMRLLQRDAVSVCARDDAGLDVESRSSRLLDAVVVDVRSLQGRGSW